MAIRDFPETTDEMVSRLVKLILCKWLEMCFIKSILQGGFVAAKGVFFQNLVYLNAAYSRVTPLPSLPSTALGLPDNPPVLITLLGGGRHCDSKVFCSRTQHNDEAGARTRATRCGVQSNNYQAATFPTKIVKDISDENEIGVLCMKRFFGVRESLQ